MTTTSEWVEKAEKEASKRYSRAQEQKLWRAAVSGYMMGYIEAEKDCKDRELKTGNDGNTQI